MYTYTQPISQIICILIWIIVLTIAVKILIMSWLICPPVLFNVVDISCTFKSNGTQAYSNN